MSERPSVEKINAGDNTEPSVMGTKFCKRCRIEKDVVDFWKKSFTSIGRLLYFKYCRKCMGEIRMEKGSEFRTRQLRNMKKYHRGLKLRVFEAYGGCRCVKCGRADLDALTLDHIHNNGKEHRKRLFGGDGQYSSSSMYRNLRDLGFPPGFQVLCSGCNLAKHVNGGNLDLVIPIYEGVTAIPKGSTPKWAEAPPNSLS